MPLSKIGYTARPEDGRVNSKNARRFVSVALFPIDHFHGLAGKGFFHIAAVIADRDAAANSGVTQR